MDGRDLCGKYKATKGKPSIQQYLALEQYLANYKRNYLFICEGFPDAISLWQLGINAVGILGLEGINNHTHKFRPFKHLIFCFDNDRHPQDGSPYAGQYKSWTRILPQLITLQQSLTKAKISIFIPPEESGIKDINDFCLQYKNKVKPYINKNHQELSDFLLDLWGKDLKKHGDLIKLLAIKNNLNKMEPLIPNISKVEYAHLILNSIGN